MNAAAGAYAAGSLERLVDVLQPAFEALDLSYFNVFDAVSDGHVHVLHRLFGRPHPTWHAHYLQEQLYRRDFRVRHALLSSAPFFASEALGSSGAMSEDERAFANIAARFGLAETFVLPHRTADSRLFMVLAAGAGRRIVDGAYHVAALCLASSFLYTALRIEKDALVSPWSGRTRRQLTRRQLECLEWSRHGKSSADIGEILGLSPRTVDEHLAAVCRSLDVRTRVQAVSAALTQGILPYPLVGRPRGNP